MARLSEMRSSIVEYISPVEVVEVIEEEEGEDFVFDDEDFWEAIDLIEGSYKMLKALMRRCQIPKARKRLVENHCEDLKQFVDMFVPEAKGAKP